LIQLRSGHIGLNKHLHRIKKSPMPICPHCRTYPETVSHFLTQCSEYREPRRKLRAELGHKASNIKYLLSDSKALPALYRYITETGRFAQTHGNV
ncbi:hypothetical protein PUNSTDRAFT_27365, partial [Punctularia strigosozonata HHB-11173 SS5]|uniref:uncharacterized protein n=1 Tax=Punctularia strigosozonata (strain HHB-11173) TaxID=741275 RepID=UPI00044183C8